MYKIEYWFITDFKYCIDYDYHNLKEAIKQARKIISVPGILKIAIRNENQKIIYGIKK